MDAPDIFEYLDHRAFLRDWFDAKKSQNPRFSHRLFARLAGLRSPSALAHVVSGRRNLSPATVEAFSKAMKLDEERAGYFAALVGMAQGGTEGERERDRRAVEGARHFRAARRVDDESAPALSRWTCAAILELAQHPRFREDTAWIAATLRPPITPAQAGEALSLLEGAGLLTRGAAGRLRPAQEAVVTEVQTAAFAMGYHREMLQRARDALEDVPQAERVFFGLTLSVPHSALDALRREMAAFGERALHLCDAACAEAPADRVHQLNLQLFPLSDQIGIRKP